VLLSGAPLAIAQTDARPSEAAKAALDRLIADVKRPEGLLAWLHGRTFPEWRAAPSLDTAVTRACFRPKLVAKGAPDQSVSSRLMAESGVPICLATMFLTSFR
jgi:hypothetical protein